MNGYNRTYLIGAGLSHSYSEDYPLSSEFFAKMRSKVVAGKKFMTLNPALEEVDAFLNRFFPVSPDLEEVLSFLSQEYFPPDFRQHWQHRADVYQELLWNIPRFLWGAAPRSPEVHTLLHDFCGLIVKEAANIVTFNYDCLLEEELYRQHVWEPSSGYGIPMQFMGNVLSPPEKPLKTFKSDLTILKLHGSVNWGTSPLAYANAETEVFYHPPLDHDTHNIGDISVSLRSSKSMSFSVPFTPFIVPPILDKTKFYHNRFLQRLWFLARECIAFSENITIIGYSFPETDYFARFLMREAFASHLARQINENRTVTVVNLVCDDALKRRAERILAGASIEFIEQDAFDYIAKLVTAKGK